MAYFVLLANYAVAGTRTNFVAPLSTIYEDEGLPYSTYYDNDDELRGAWRLRTLCNDDARVVQVQ
jgi:hypothetical protein